MVTALHKSPEGERFILMVMDGAPCHKDGAIDIPENMMVQRLPPYSPELNPSENM